MKRAVMNDLNSGFYPKITRRSTYSCKKNGENYNYGHYRQEIRQDCLERCVYCDILENECGGEELNGIGPFSSAKTFFSPTQ